MPSRRPSVVPPLLALISVLLLAACGDGGGGGSCRLATPSPTGPGDATGLFPMPAGARWLYDETTVVGLGSTTERWRLEVDGTRPVAGAVATVLRATMVGGSAPPQESLFVAAAGGLSEYGQGLPPPLDRLSPLLLLPFPPTPGSFEQVVCTGLDLGEDLDGDGRSERLDVRSVVTIAGAEEVRVPAGTFLATPAQTVLEVTIRATGGQQASATITQTDWLAPGVGRVRSVGTTTGGDVPESDETVLLGYQVGALRGGLLGTATLAADLAPGNSDTVMPGPPALSFDGSGHLLATPYSVDLAYAQDTLRAYVLDADGATLRLLPLVARTGYGAHPAAAFNGTNHLVVANLCSTDCSVILGQRVTPAGDVLDGASGFDVTAGGQTVYWPSVASDGDGWLAVWTRYLGGVEAARISATGEVGAPVAVGDAWGYFPMVAAGGGVYLVAWPAGERILAARVSAAGALLDATPIELGRHPGFLEVGGVAFDGTRFLVTWLQSTDPSGGGPIYDVHAARVTPDGAALDGPPEGGGILVNALPSIGKLGPRVAFDGTSFVVAWWIDGFYGEAGIRAARVLGDGTVPGLPVTSPGIPVARPTGYASRQVYPVVAPASGGRALVAWVENTEVMGERKDVVGAWLAP